MRSVLLVCLILLLPHVTSANEGGGGAGPQYIEVGPKLIVNLANSKQLMKINPQLLVEGPEAIDEVKKHMPAIKNALIMLYSSRRAEDLATAEQREALRLETFETIKNVLEERGSGEGFEDVFFSDFRIN